MISLFSRIARQSLCHGDMTAQRHLITDLLIEDSLLRCVHYIGGTGVRYSYVKPDIFSMELDKIRN